MGDGETVHSAGAGTRLRRRDAQPSTLTVTAGVGPPPIEGLQSNWLIGAPHSVEGTMRTVSKLALVTGTSSGIGAATARFLAADGYHVILVGRRKDALDAVAADIGTSAIVEPCDVADGDAVLAMADRVRLEHGVLDVIINSAGAGQWKRIEDTTPAESVAMMGAPHFAAFNTTHAFMKDMLDRGSGLFTIHITSPVSLFPWRP